MTPPGGSGGSTSTGTGGSVSATTGGSSLSTGGTPSTGTTGGTPSTGTTGGTPSTGTTGGTATSATGGTSTTTTGGTATITTGGTGGAEPQVKLCAKKTALTVPLLTNFDSYDGKSAADMWAFPFNGKTGADAPYAGAITYNDMTGTPFIGMVGGANASTYAISISNPMATGWGGALAFWMACVDASTFQGISFYARGALPTTMVNVSLTMEQTSAPSATDPNGGGTCDAAALCESPRVEVPVSTDWTLIKIPWGLFMAGIGSGIAAVTPTGDNIAGVTFQVGLTYMESPAGSMTYVPVPAMYSFELDDLGFY